MLEAHLVKPRFQRRLMLAEARRVLDNAPDPTAARRTLVARWCEAANERLAEISTYRLCGPFRNPRRADLAARAPAQYETLVREHLLSPR